MLEDRADWKALYRGGIGGRGGGDGGTLALPDRSVNKET